MLKDRFSPLPAGALHLEGELGDAILLTLKNRLKKVNYRHLVDPYRYRDERDFLWRCEFWGKIVRSAIHIQRATGDLELLSMIRETVSDMLSTQTADGCISTYPVENQTKGWDIWGRKYVMQVLARYYEEIEPDEQVRTAACRVLDHLMTQIPMDGKPMKFFGEHAGLAASSVLDAVVAVYRISGDERYLRYAQWIADGGCSQRHSIIDAAMAKLPPAEIGNGKAYELTSCFQGIADLCRICPDSRVQEALDLYWHLVWDHEIFITGIGGLKDMGGEYWFYGKNRQTLREPNVRLGETCVTTTWIRFSDNMLRMFGRAEMADAMELAYYNGLLGAMTPDGSGWTHGNPSPLSGAGFKRAADDQICGYGEDCCLAQGPEGLGMAIMDAAMLDESGLVLNLYEPMTVDLGACFGGTGKLQVVGGYPYEEDSEIRFSLGAPLEKTLTLRIPAWFNENCTVSLNGEVLKNAVPGAYLPLNRIWQDGDTIQIHVDLKPHKVISPDLSCTAVMSGPIVLAQDSRLEANGAIDLPLDDLNGAVRSEAKGFRMYWKLANGTQLVDYASAGSGFGLHNMMRVWF